jgi:hypothetical protein
MNAPNQIETISVELINARLNASREIVVFTDTTPDDTMLEMRYDWGTKEYRIYLGSNKTTPVAHMRNQQAACNFFNNLLTD